MTTSAHATAPQKADLTPFDWADAFDLDGQLTEEERLVRDTARDYAQAWDQSFAKTLNGRVPALEDL